MRLILSQEFDIVKGMPESELEPLLLTVEEVARVLGVSASGLRKWRREGSGPPFILLGSLVRYTRQGLVDWIESCSVKATAK